MNQQRIIQSILIALLLLPVLLTAQKAATPTVVPDAAPVDTFNYIAGTMVFDSAYHFTDQSLLMEGSGQVLALGSSMIKCALAPNHFAPEHLAALSKGYVNTEPNIQSDTQLAQQTEYKKLFNMPFNSYIMWTYAFSTVDKIFPLHGPIKQEVLDSEYKEIYDLTKYLLTTYNGTGKSFYLGNWEGDWHLLEGVPGRSDPALKRKIDPFPDSPAAMASWLNTRQHAIEDARRDTPHRNVAVWFYVEANLVQKSIKENRVSMAHDVIPLVNPDFVSYSAYDSTDKDKDLHHDLPIALDYLQSKLKPKPGLPEKRVFIGEFGAPAMHYTAQEQDARVRDVIATAIKWGTPFVLYWEFYNNELEPDGTQRGFWLIDDKRVMQPAYFTYKSYYRDARAYVATFTKENKRKPTDQEFQAFAVKWFTSPVKQ